MQADLLTDLLTDRRVALPFRLGYRRAVFSNLNWTNVAILLLLALFIFGDKLPQIISDGLRMLRNLRRMANNATSDLSRELGTEIRVEDLNPRTFVRKHILSEADQEKLLKPLKGVSDDVVAQAKGIERDFREVGRDAERTANQAAGTNAAGTNATGAKATGAPATGAARQRRTRGSRSASSAASSAASGTGSTEAPVVDPAPDQAGPEAPQATRSASYDELP